MTETSTSARPAVSVLMPVWRPNLGFLLEAVHSVLQQTQSDLELVIVDKPSPVDIKPTIESINDPRVHVFSAPPESTIVEQLNEGLRHCRGPLVARMDADDVCHQDRIEQQVRFLQTHPDIAVLGSQIDLIDENGRPIGTRHYPQSHDAILAAMPFYNGLAHPSVIFRREAVREAGGYQQVRITTFKSVPWCQDYDLWARMIRSGARLANQEQVLLAYRVHAGQIKSENVRDVLRATVSVKHQYWRASMTYRARLRLILEKILICLPAKLIVRLFLLIQRR